MRSFASDNNSGVHPDILKAIETANQGHAIAYGNDEITQRAIQKFKDTLGQQVEVFFTFTGTAANVLGLSAAMRPYNAVICSELAHINVDECGAPERFLSGKLLLVPTEDGKITIDGIKKHIHGFGDQHHVQPKAISVSQVTEMGTVYTVEELKALAECAHQNNMVFHVDGARLSNAAVSLGKTFKEMVSDTGVDILSFGGTKNGMMFGEAVVFLRPELSEGFKFMRKQGMQLASKMRYVSAQFEAYLTNNKLSLPVEWFFGNYEFVWVRVGFYNNVKNSVIYSVITTFVVVILANMSGYGFAKFGYKVTKALHGLFIIGILLTIQSILIPLFLVISAAGLLNTRLGILIPYIGLGLPMGVYLATDFIRNIPDELIESARIDGASYLKIFVSIIFPMCTPVSVTLAIVSFIGTWNEFILMSLFTSSPEFESIPAAAGRFAGNLGADYGKLFATLSMALIPILVFYLIFKDQITKGVAAGAVKG